MPSLPIVVLVAGDTVPQVQQERGPFPVLIAARIGDAWPGKYKTVDVRTEPLPDPNGAAAFIITGSASSVPDREAWMLRTEAFLRDVVPMGVPVFGICFGHQMLAQALGGLVAKNPRGREMGTKAVERLTDDVVFEGLPQRFFVNATHVDTVVRCPAGAAVLARSPLDDHQVIRFSPTCYGAQFHPEIDAGIMRAYISTRRAILEKEGFVVDSMLTETTDGSDAQRLLQNFARRVVLEKQR